MNVVKGVFGIQDAPAAPSAAELSAAQRDSADYNAKLNRVSQYTPYGSLKWTQDANGNWTQNVNLSDVGQKLLDADNNTSLDLAGLQSNAAQRVAGMQSTPFDYSSVDDVYNKSYSANTSRLDDRFGREQSQMQTQLANQGIMPGSEAYTNAMKDFSYGKNDAYQQAENAAISTMPQTFQLAQALRSQPLNELNALRSGSQVTNPTFTPVQQQQGVDYGGAMQQGYQGALGQTNANNAFGSNFMNGLFSLGGQFASGGKGKGAPTAAAPI